MDLAKELVRTVARAFYETQHIVIVDALVNHNAISLADMGVILDIGTSSHKTAQKLCGRLREGGLIAVFVRQELKEGAMKPTNKEYYWIDYRRAIDAIKYRVHILDEKVKADSKPTSEKNEYKCPRCSAEYTMMAVLDLRDPLSPSGFRCKRCDSNLRALPRDGDGPAEGSDDTVARFNKQFGKILRLLEKIDNTTIPANSGEEALGAALPVPRDKTNPGAKSSTVVHTGGKAATVKGVAAGPEKIELSITDEADEKAKARENALDQQKKAAQNALPAWYTQSTVTGESIMGDKNPSSDLGNGIGGLGADEEKDEKDDIAGDATLDDYFAMLKKEQEEKANQPSDEEDDEEDEFEDVGIAPKRVKIEENGSAAAAAAPPVSVPASTGPTKVVSGGGSEDESDEEDEFEDVA